MRSDIEILFLLSGLVLISLIFLSSLILLFVAYFFARDIFEYLSNSPAVISRKRTLGWEPIGRFLFISSVGTLMIFSRKSIRNGELDAKDYEALPVGLRRIILFSNGMMLVLSTIAIIGAVLGKVNGWLS
ncbi:hypothetical protein ACIP66_23455 [Pseudomonas sp. NPDC088429]|uniref:hypothetical protein n=1 Tax=Pseudomonas sp. NPDC088429 TaxID=3364455 RepID=UPI003823F4B8